MSPFGKTGTFGRTFPTSNSYVITIYGPLSSDKKSRVLTALLRSPWNGLAPVSVALLWVDIFLFCICHAWHDTSTRKLVYPKVSTCHTVQKIHLGMSFCSELTEHILQTTLEPRFIVTNINTMMTWYRLRKQTGHLLRSDMKFTLITAVLGVILAPSIVHALQACKTAEDCVNLVCAATLIPCTESVCLSSGFCSRPLCTARGQSCPVRTWILYRSLDRAG